MFVATPPAAAHVLLMLSAMDPWFVRADYTFSEGATSVDELDRLVGGRVRGVRGTSHSINFGPEQTTLEWEVDSMSAASAAVKALEPVPGVRDPRASPVRPSRMLRPDEYQIRASDARAGRAVCVACRARIREDMHNLFALEGVAPGNEITLRCERCGFSMGWVILSEDPSPPR